MTLKLIRRALVVALLLLVAGFCFWYFGVWSVRRTFEETHFDGLSNVLQAAVGSSLAGAARTYEAAQGPSDIGALDVYRKHPGQMESDKNLFTTWFNALSIADSALHQHAPTGWQSSESLSWISPHMRRDAWQHAFCLSADKNTAMVISPGIGAVASLDCREVVLTDEELKSFAPGRLNRHPSGALVLLVRAEKR